MCRFDHGVVSDAQNLLLISLLAHAARRCVKDMRHCNHYTGNKVELHRSANAGVLLATFGQSQSRRCPASYRSQAWAEAKASQFLLSRICSNHGRREPYLFLFTFTAFSILGSHKLQGTPFVSAPICQGQPSRRRIDQARPARIQQHAVTAFLRQSQLKRRSWRSVPCIWKLLESVHASQVLVNHFGRYSPKPVLMASSSLARCDSQNMLM